MHGWAEDRRLVVLAYALVAVLAAAVLLLSMLAQDEESLPPADAEIEAPLDS